MVALALLWYRYIINRSDDMTVPLIRCDIIQTTYKQIYNKYIRCGITQKIYKSSLGVLSCSSMIAKLANRNRLPVSPFNFPTILFKNQYLLYTHTHTHTHACTHIPSLFDYCQHTDIALTIDLGDN